MRRIGLGLAAVIASSASTLAYADGDVAATAAPAPADAAPAPAPLGYAALPGGVHVPSAAPLPAGQVAIGLVGGYGYRKGLLAADETLDRGIGDVAIGVGVTDLLSLALALDGRYDKHFHLAPSGDDGYVGDPRLIARLGKRVGAHTVGAQLGVWVPGKDAPSVAASAISVEARALATLAAGPGHVDLAAGFRLDNSAKSIDDATKLSVQDQVSLGVSKYKAAVVGAAFAIPAGKAFVTLEGSADLFVGSGAPGPIVRGGVSGGVHVTDQFSLLAFVEGAHVPKIASDAVAMNAIPLVPYEPTITGGIALQAQFGGPTRAVVTKPAGEVTKNNQPAKVEVVEYAELAGIVVDENGKPVAGAKVTIKLKNHTGTAVTDGTGAYKVEKLPIGKTIDGATALDDTSAEVAIEVDGKKPSTTTLVLAKGANAVPKLALEPMLPPGQLRALVKSLVSGKPIAGATVKVEPGGATATSDADGKFQVDLPPGKYKITVTAPGLATQELDVTIDPNGVAIKNIDLHK